MDIGWYGGKSWLHRAVVFQRRKAVDLQYVTVFHITPLNEYLSSERQLDQTLPESIFYADKQFTTQTRPSCIVRTMHQESTLNALTGLVYLIPDTTNPDQTVIYLKLLSLHPQRETSPLMEVKLTINQFCHLDSNNGQYQCINTNFSNEPNYPALFQNAHIVDAVQINNIGQQRARIIILGSSFDNIGTQNFIIDFGYACEDLTQSCINNENPMLKPISRSPNYENIFFGMQYLTNQSQIAVLRIEKESNVSSPNQAFNLDFVSSESEKGGYNCFQPPISNSVQLLEYNFDWSIVSRNFLWIKALVVGHKVESNLHSFYLHVFYGSTLKNCPQMASSDWVATFNNNIAYSSGSTQSILYGVQGDQTYQSELTACETNKVDQFDDNWKVFFLSNDGSRISYLKFKSYFYKNTAQDYVSGFTDNDIKFAQSQVLNASVDSLNQRLQNVVFNKFPLEVDEQLINILIFGYVTNKDPTNQIDRGYPSFHLKSDDFNRDQFEPYMPNTVYPMWEQEITVTRDSSSQSYLPRSGDWESPGQHISAISVTSKFYANVDQQDLQQNLSTLLSFFSTINDSTDVIPIMLDIETSNFQQNQLTKNLMYINTAYFQDYTILDNSQLNHGKVYVGYAWILKDLEKQRIPNLRLQNAMDQSASLTLPQKELTLGLNSFVKMKMPPKELVDQKSGSSVEGWKASVETWYSSVVGAQIVDTSTYPMLWYGDRLPLSMAWKQLANEQTNRVHVSMVLAYRISAPSLALIGEQVFQTGQQLSDVFNYVDKYNQATSHLISFEPKPVYFETSKTYVSASRLIIGIVNNFSSETSFFYQDELDTQFIFKLKEQLVQQEINLAPYMSPIPPKTVTISINQEQLLQLGQAKDKNVVSSMLKIEVDLRTTSKFATYIPSQNVIIFEAMNLIKALQNRGDHTIFVSVLEVTGLSDSLKTSYPILITVINPNVDESPKVKKQIQELSDLVKNNKKLEKAIDILSKEEEDKIDFKDLENPIKYAPRLDPPPGELPYKEIPQPPSKSNYFSTFAYKPIKIPVARISKVSTDGNSKLIYPTQVRFPKDLKEIIIAQKKAQQALASIEKTKRHLKGSNFGGSSIIDFKFSRSFQNDEEEENLLEKIGFDWTVTKVTSSSIGFNFFFKKPLIVSQEEKPDKIECTLRMSAFTDEYGQPLRDQKLSVEVPQQVRSANEAQVINQSAESATTTAASVMGANFVLGIILALSLNSLWSMLNGLQLLVHMPLFRTHFPSNALLMLSFITKIATFDLLPEEWVLASIDLPFFDKKSLSLEFEECGYEHIYPIYNLGTTFFLIQLYFGMIIFYYLILGPLSCCSKWAFRKRMNLKAELFWSVPLRFMLEGYLEIGVSVFIGLYNLNDWGENDYALWYQNVFTIFFAAFIVVFPFWILFYLLIVKESQLTKKGFHSKFGSMYEGLKLKSRSISRRVAISYVLYFVVRRISLIIMSIMLMNYPIFNILLQLVISVTVISYLLSFKIFKDNRFTNLEIFNEVCSLATLYLVLFFTDFVRDVDLRYLVGWLFIVVVSFNIGVHAFLMAKDTCIQFAGKCKSRLKISKSKAKKGFKETKKKQKVAKKTVLSQIKEESEPYEESSFEIAQDKLVSASQRKEKRLKYESNSHQDSDKNLQIQHISRKRNKKLLQPYPDYQLKQNTLTERQKKQTQQAVPVITDQEREELEAKALNAFLERQTEQIDDFTGQQVIIPEIPDFYGQDYKNKLSENEKRYEVRLDSKRNIIREQNNYLSVQTNLKEDMITERQQKRKDSGQYYENDDLQSASIRRQSTQRERRRDEQQFSGQKLLKESQKTSRQQTQFGLQSYDFISESHHIDNMLYRHSHTQNQQ